MASGSFEFGTSNKYITGKVDWTSVKNDSANTSSVTVILYYKKSSASTSATYGTFNGNININGSIASISKRITLNCNNTYIEVGRLTIPNIQHNDDGKKTITISAGGGISGTTFSSSNGSTNAVLDTIPRESKITNFSNFIIGNTFKINITKYSAFFIDTLTLKCQNTIIKTIRNYVSGTNINFSTSELNTIYSLMKTLKEATFTATITTKSDNTTIGSNSKTAIGSLEDCNPTFKTSNVTYYDDNTNTTKVTGNNQHIVQSLSNIIVKITAATANKGATISKYIAKLNGVEKTITAAGTINFGKINSSKNLTLEVIAIDSRGNSTIVEKTITFLEWSLPHAEIDLHRLNNYEDTSYLTIDAQFSSVNNKNSISIQYKFSVNKDFEATSQNFLEGDAIGMSNPISGYSTSITCNEIPLSEITKMKNGRVVIKFSEQNYITEEINGNYYDIMAHLAPFSVNQYITEFLIFRYDISTKKVIYNEELPGMYLNYGIVESVNKKAISYKYILFNMNPVMIDINNKEQKEMILSKERIWHFKIYINDKFGQIIYNIDLPKGKPIFYIDIKNLAVGINCFPKGKGGLWTDDEWEDIDLEDYYVEDINYYPPQYKKLADKIVFRGLIHSEAAFENGKVGNIDYKPSKKITINSFNTLIEIRPDGGIYVIPNGITNELYLDGLSFFID